MSGPSRYDARLGTRLMKTSSTFKIVANCVYRTGATGLCDPKKQIAANDLAWEVAA